MLSQNMTDKIIDYIMSHGGDFAEVFAEHTRRNQLAMTGGNMSEALAGIESGVGIRIFSGDQCAYFYTEDEREENLFRLLKENWKAGEPVRPDWEKLSADQKIYDSTTEYFQSASVKDKMKLMEKCDKAGLAYSSQISQMYLKYLDMDQHVQIANSEGCYMEDHRMKTRLSIEAIVRDDQDVQRSYYGPGAMGGYEFLKQINVEECARKVAQNAIRCLGARACPTGRMPVIIANGFGGLFFHEACGHSLEATSVSDNGSEFSGKLGTKVASEKVTLIDDGSIRDGWGSGYIDDEGELTRKNVLIKDGILKNYLVDRLNGKKLGLSANGSSRRESYRFAPVARMSNTYIAPGSDDVEKMIASVDRGIYVKSINAGSVNSITGEFNFNTGETFLIEHGEITVPVHSATLIGTGGDILQKVEQVGKDYELGQGFCYAGSGAIYIGAGQPTVKVSEMTVGGDEIC